MLFNVSIALFALAAAAGLAMAIMHFRGATPPRPVLATLHGLFAAAGLVVLALAVVQVAAGGAAVAALALFVLAALGGFFLLSFHLRGRALPGGLVVGHGALAVAGFVTLAAAVFVAAG